MGKRKSGGRRSPAKTPTKSKRATAKANPPNNPGAFWSDRQFRNAPAELIAIFKAQGYVPATGETFYEAAWRARVPLARKAVAEGRGNLARTLALYEKLERTLIVSLPMLVAQGMDVGRIYTGQVNLIAAELESAPAPPAAIVAATKPAVVDGVERRIFAAENQRDLIVAWLRQIAAGRAFDAIVELGSGYGLNLFKLYDQGGPAGIPYYAGEYTQSGRELTVIFARVDRNAPVKPVYFNHRAPDLAFLGKARRVLIYSCHSIEQVAEIPADYFDVLARAAPEVLGVHFEPFGFQLGGADPVSNAHRAFIRDQNYNTNLIDCLKAAEGRGAVAVRHLAANVIAPQPENPTSIAIWENQP